MSSAVYNYIENVTVLSNRMYEYKTLKNKKALGDELVKVLNKYNCEPAKALYKVTDGSNRYGFRLMKIVSDAPLRLKYESGLSVRDGIGEIGKGVYGTVYIGCIDKKCKKEVAIKMADAKENRLEYNFMKKFEGISPNITHAYYYKKCPAPIRSILYLEYYSFGSARRLITKYETKLRKLHTRVILFQVIWTLAELHKKFPTFRHNDLHLENIFIDERVSASASIRYGNFVVPSIGMNALIGDFGFANMQERGFMNKKVQSGIYKNDYGITVNNDYRYDVHFFLNDMFRTTKNQELKNFIKRHFPDEYLTGNSKVVENNRLRFGVDHSKLPTFEQLLNDKFFRFFKPRGNTVITPTNSFPKTNKKVVAPKRVIARPLAPSPVKKTPPTFRLENLEKRKKVVAPSSVQKKVFKESKLVQLLKSSPVKAKHGVILNKNSVKFTNGSTRGKKCETFRKDVIVSKAKLLGITGVEKMSKEKICAIIKNALA